MNTKTTTKALVAAGLLAAGIGVGAAQAASGSAPTDAQDKTEMQAALSAKVSLVDAVTAAQSQVDGKAMAVVFSDENGQPGYEVTFVALDGSEHDLIPLRTPSRRDAGRLIRPPDGRVHRGTRHRVAF